MQPPATARMSATGINSSVGRRGAPRRRFRSIRLPSIRRALGPRTFGFRCGARKLRVKRFAKCRVNIGAGLRSRPVKNYPLPTAAFGHRLWSLNLSGMMLSP